MSWILVLGTGPSQAPLIHAARRRGFSIIGIDRLPNPNLVDVEIPISTYEADKIINELDDGKKYPKPSGVLCRSSGPPLKTAVSIANKYSLPSSGSTIAECSISKLALFNWAKENKIPTIATLRCTGLEKIPSQWEVVIVKPSSPVFGKKNVFLIDKHGDLASAIKIASTESLDGYALVQPFIDGIDVCMVTVARNGKLLWSSFFQETVSFKNGAAKGEGVGSLGNNLRNEELQVMAMTAKLLIKKSNASGFVFFSFRCPRKQAPMLYEVNPGLCGDNIAEKLFPAMWPNFDFYDLDVASATNDLLRFPSSPPLTATVSFRI